MKFNWGHGLTLGMILFVGYIMFMVVQALQTDHDLETEDYYAKELLFQETIDKNKNFLLLKKYFVVRIENKKMFLVFPHTKIDSGSITLYRPSDKKLDSSYLLNISDSGSQTIDVSDKPIGRYILEADWRVDDKGFFLKKSIVL
jgi:hypothetical protein